MARQACFVFISLFAARTNYTLFFGVNVLNVDAENLLVLVGLLAQVADQAGARPVHASHVTPDVGLVKRGVGAELATVTQRVTHGQRLEPSTCKMTNNDNFLKRVKKSVKGENEKNKPTFSVITTTLCLSRPN